MRLGGFDFFTALKTGSNRLVRILTLPFYQVYRKIYRKINPNNFVNRVVVDIRSGSKKMIGEKPTSLKDYV